MSTGAKLKVAWGFLLLLVGAYWTLALNAAVPGHRFFRGEYTGYSQTGKYGVGGPRRTGPPLLVALFVLGGLGVGGGLASKRQ